MLNAFNKHQQKCHLRKQFYNFETRLFHNNFLIYEKIAGLLFFCQILLHCLLAGNQQLCNYALIYFVLSKINFRKT